MRNTRFFCLLVALLCFCACSGKTVQASSQIQSQPAAVEALPLPSAPEVPPVEASVAAKQRGSGAFADAGALTARQQDIILRYMDAYYNSLADLRMHSMAGLFAEDAEMQMEGNRAIWEYLIGIRSMQDNDLTLTGYQYDLTWQSTEGDKEGEVTVRVSEHNIQNFTAYPGVDAEAFNIIHSFTLAEQQDGSWRISNHRQMDSTTWMVMGRTAFRNANLSPVLARQALAEMETQKRELLDDARAAVAARSTGGTVLAECDEAYNREAAVAYAREWVGKRSDAWPDYSRNGGNCQNFTSQCLYASGIPMDVQYPGIWKWYGSTPDNLSAMAGRSASWSAVSDFLDYVKNNRGYGLAATAGAPYYSGQPGDILHMGSEAEHWRHTVMITDVLTNEAGETTDYLICSNTADLKNFPASAYPYAHQLLIQIHGWNYA